MTPIGLPPGVRPGAEIHRRVRDVSGEGNKLAVEMMLRKGRRLQTIPGCDCCFRVVALYKVRGVGNLCRACLKGKCPKDTCRTCPLCGAWFLNHVARTHHLEEQHPRAFAKLAARVGAAPQVDDAPAIRRIRRDDDDG